MNSFRPQRADIVSGLALLVSLLALLWASPTWQRSQPTASSPPSHSSRPALDDNPAAQAAPPEASVSSTPPSLLLQISQTSAEVIARVSRSVVRVEQLDSPRTRTGDPLEAYFGTSLGENFGSGFVVDANGLILTNYHVVRGSGAIRVFSPNRQLHDAQLLGFDALTDLALLSVPELGLPALAWGNSQQVRSGQLVWAIGCPYGLDQSVSMGIISSVDRPTLLDSPFQDFFQTDASINPGSSGGPLIDSSGEIIGINTAIAGDEFSGIGFALPSHTAQNLLAQLRRPGQVPRGWIGIQLGPVTPARASQAGVAVGRGAYIESLASGSDVPAAKADLRVSDICTHFQGEAVSGPLGLIRLIAAHPIDTTATLQLIRNGQPLSVDVVVLSRP